MFVNIPNCVEKIGTSAFCGNRYVCVVTIPESVYAIGTGAFYGCEFLTDVKIPDSVRAIGMSPFEGCPLLEPKGIDCPGWIDKNKLLAGPENWDYGLFNSYSV